MKCVLVTTTNMHFVTTEESEDLEEFVTVFRQKKKKGHITKNPL